MSLSHRTKGTSECEGRFRNMDSGLPRNVAYSFVVSCTGKALQVSAEVWRSSGFQPQSGISFVQRMPEYLHGVGKHRDEALSALRTKNLTTREGFLFGVSDSGLWLRSLSFPIDADSHQL